MNFTKRIIPFSLVGSAVVVGVVVLFGAQTPEPATPFLFFEKETQRIEEVQTTEEPVVGETIVAETKKSPNKSVPAEVPIPDTSVTVAGILAETNAQRIALGLSPFSFNAQLTVAAQAKVADMISRQYFEHESPDGKGPGDLADAAGYEYLAVAENLALGDYENSAEIVEGWMDSPGHRENIVSTTFSDIGVAVGRGMFEGDWVWFAVQEFGRPASDCPLPSTALEARIEDSRRTLAETQGILEETFKEIENTEPKYGSAYNAKIDAYNDLVETYNKLIAETETLVEMYNSEVKAYNECAQQ